MKIDPKRKAQGTRLAKARAAAGFRSAREAALESGWPESSYRAHEGGTRTIGQDDAERYARRFQGRGVQVEAKSILFGDEDEPDESAALHRSAPVMGYIGAGAHVEPDYEQVPEDGIEKVEVPFDIPADIIAFVVRGDSMRPVYKDGDTILVWREQRLATENFVGEVAAVRLDDGRRFLKELQKGPSRGSYNLYSYNDRLIEGARIAWVGEVYLIVPALQARRMEKRARTSSARKRNVG